MPKGTKVHDCVQKYMKKHPKAKKSTAIKICQESTGQSYKTGKKPKNKRNKKK